jgi:hypothetical protein
MRITQGVMVSRLGAGMEYACLLLSGVLSLLLNMIRAICADILHIPELTQQQMIQMINNYTA